METIVPGAAPALAQHRPRVHTWAHEHTSRWAGAGRPHACLQRPARHARYLVAGPDAYRDLPRLIGKVDEGEKAVNTFLSREETYAYISPVRLHSNGVTAFISIMRGCDNMCSFCVVPFTRGRERSRNPDSIVAEAQGLRKLSRRSDGQLLDQFHDHRREGQPRAREVRYPGDRRQGPD